MRINISRAVFERLEGLGQDLTDDIIIKAIELTRQGSIQPETKWYHRRDMFDRLEFTKPTKESTINGNLVSELIFKRYNIKNPSWKNILGEVINISARGIRDVDKIGEIFDVYFTKGKIDTYLYIEELNATTWSPTAPDACRAIAKGGKILAYSVHIKFKRFPRNVDYKTLGEYGEFKININGKDCEIS